ncbi:MAG: ATP-binding protein [Candidatus Marinimicrobia bacterium]|nr:ATP-binding protein [Candidatus Neomarinimicrobiota bacterium]
MSIDWQEANRTYLMARIALVREAIDHHASHGKAGDALGKTRKLTQAIEQAEAALEAPSALEVLCTVFDLSTFERDILLACAAMDLSAEMAQACANANANERCNYPTFALALAALPDAYWNALTPSSPLRYWRLVEMAEGTSLTSTALQINESVLHYLMGVHQLDERLMGSLRTISAADGLADSHRAHVQRLKRLWATPHPGEVLTVAYLCGIDQSAKATIFGATCDALEIPHYVINGGQLGANNDVQTILRLWEREAILNGTALLIEAGPEMSPEVESSISQFAERFTGRLVIACRDPLRQVSRSGIVFEVQRPSMEEQRTIWESTLESVATNLNGTIDRLVSQFDFSQTQVRAAAAEALESPSDQAEAAGDDPEAWERRLWALSLAQARPQLDGAAQRIVVRAGWEDIVLPEMQMQTLRGMVAQARHRAKVYWDWGFSKKNARGLGMSALFAGPSGTGKTLAAEILAYELNLDLYRVDLSAVVSKYIGETEKNLRRVFDAAESGGVLLLFDEADALFGKRGEVKDSHDRYANIEVSYLLQRMEAYRGLAILTTNLEDALDTAFMRRIRFVVHFPFPNAGLRSEIWRRIFPEETPIDGLDYAKLARLNVAGGNIRNIAINAAFLAADSDTPVEMGGILRAARTEYAKIKKTLTDAEIGDWA